jgi:hypothetical protein
VSAVEERISEVFDRAGCEGRLHATTLDGAAEVAIGEAAALAVEALRS